MNTRNPSSAQPAKPDYKSPSFRGALMTDYWVLDPSREFSMVPSSCIAEVNRASEAITVISRLVHNSLSEPEMSNAEPLGASAHNGLLCALEIVGRYLGELGGLMNVTAGEFARIDQEAQEADRG